MRAAITVDLIRELRKRAGEACEVRDTKMPGLVLRIRESGHASYTVVYGRGKKLNLGDVKVLTPIKARELAQEVLVDVARGKDPQAERRKRRAGTFRDFLTKDYEPWATAHRKTGDEQTARLRSVFGPTLNALALHDISAFHIERWRSARLKDVTPQTANRDLNVLRGALSRAVEWGLLTSHPLATVKPSKTDRRAVVRYLSDDEETRLHAALTARDNERRAARAHANAWRRERGYATWPEYGTYTDHLTPLVTLALHTGLRRGELFHLRWRDVDLLAARLTVRGEGSKTGQTRHVPLNAEALRVIRTWREQSAASGEAPEAYVFPGRDRGQPLEDIKSAWLALMTDAKITGFRFHDCRHDFASKLVMKGVDLNTVRELLGHSDIKMVLRYAHLAPAHTAAAVAKLVSA